MSDWYGEQGDDNRQGGGRRGRDADAGYGQSDRMPWERAAAPGRGQDRVQDRAQDRGWQPEPAPYGGSGRGQDRDDRGRGYADARDRGGYDYDDDDSYEIAESGRARGRGRGGAGYPGAKKKLTPAVIGGRVLASVLGAAVVIATGSVWYVNKSINDSLNTSDATNASKPGEGGYVPKHLGNDVNLLLIGLDSRKDMNGNDLPTDLVESELHAGSSSIGGYNTNVLIFMHIPANGGKVTAYSIPRDSDVDRPAGSSTVAQVPTFPDDGVGKIKEAYGDAKAYAEGKLRAAGITDKAKMEALSREVGREATIAAVQKLTGEHVDHFAEVNLLGFYDIVKAVGNIQVCLKAPANDPIMDGAGTGINLPAGLNTIDAATALQFVRQRFHLPNGDLDRTHRQQAFLSSVTHKLASEGIFGDLGKMQSLMKVVANDIVIDKNDNWDVLDFAQRASNLTGGNAEFITLPTHGGITVKGEEALKVDPEEIKTTFKSTFENDAAVAPTTSAAPSTSAPAAPSTAPTAAAPSVKITVDNGTTSTGLALKVASFIMDKTGVPAFKTGNGGNVYHTVIKYGSGGEDEAKKIAAAMQVPATPMASSSLPSGTIVVTVGSDFKRSLLTESAGTPTTGSTGGGTTGGGATATGGDTSSDSNGLSSGTAVSASSENGIPCVY